MIWIFAHGKLERRRLFPSWFDTLFGVVHRIALGKRVSRVLRFHRLGDDAAQSVRILVELAVGLIVVLTVGQHEFDGDAKHPGGWIASSVETALDASQIDGS